MRQEEDRSLPSVSWAGQLHGAGLGGALSLVPEPTGGSPCSCALLRPPEV